MDVKRVPITELVLDPRNARKGNVPAVAESLKAFGQHRPVVVQAGTNRVIAGNHLVRAAQTALGWTHVDVLFVDDDDEKAVRRAIADNAVGDQATWDDRQLASLLAEVGMDVPGVDKAMADRLHRLLHPEKADQPAYTIQRNPGENYDYVLVVADNLVDSTWLETFFGGYKTVGSYKDKSVGRSRVVFVEELRQRVRQGHPEEDPERKPT